MALTSGITALVILGLCVIMFVTEWIPSVLAACVGCMLMVLFNVCSFSDAFSGFSNSITILAFSALVVGNAMFDTGAAQLIGRQVVKLSRNNERIFLAAMCTVSGVLSMFLANTAVIAAFLPIIDSVCRASDKMRRRNLTLPLALSAMFGGACTLIGCTPQLTANGLLQSFTGMEMGMFDLFPVGICILIIYIIYISTFGLNLGDKIWGGRPENDMEIDQSRVDAAMNTKYDKKKLTTILVIVVAMLIGYIGAWVSTTMTAAIAAVLCIITGCTNIKSVTKNMNWETIIFLAACLGLAEALNVSGAGDIMSDAVSGLLSGISSPWLVFAILVLITLLISEFITNSAAIIIVLPAALSVCQALGYNPMPFCLGITYGASFACSTPLAASQIAMTLVAGYKFSDYFKYTLPLAIISYIAIIILVPIFFPLVG